MPPTTKVGTRTKCATGMKTLASPSPQNIPSPPRIRPNRVPGGCTTTTAVTGLGSYPNAVSRAST